jgi:capsular polysaccharide biosynthesis protein
MPPTRNYYHFLIEILPRTLATIRKYPDCDIWILEEAAPAWQLNFLEELGIRWKRINAATALCFDYFAVTGRRYLDFRQEDFELLSSIVAVPGLRPSEVFGQLDEAANRRLYLARRGGSRVPSWEADLIRMLMISGWEIHDMHKYTLRKQAQVMQGAHVVVSPTGAALANCIWTGPATTVCGLFLPNLQQGIVWDNLTEISGAPLRIVPDRYLVTLRDATLAIDSLLSQ